MSAPEPTATQEARKLPSAGISDNCRSSSKSSFSAYRRLLPSELPRVNFAERFMTRSDTSLMLHDVRHPVNILQEYYEGAPLFYSLCPQMPKTFKPVLLYHSYDDDCHSRATGTLQENLNTTDIDGKFYENLKAADINGKLQENVSTAGINGKLQANLSTTDIKDKLHENLNTTSVNCKLHENLNTTDVNSNIQTRDRLTVKCRGETDKHEVAQIYNVKRDDLFHQPVMEGIKDDTKRMVMRSPSLAKDESYKTTNPQHCSNDSLFNLSKRGARSEEKSIIRKHDSYSTPDTNMDHESICYISAFNKPCPYPIFDFDTSKIYSHIVCTDSTGFMKAFLNDESFITGIYNPNICGSQHLPKSPPDTSMVSSAVPTHKGFRAYCGCQCCQTLKYPYYIHEDSVPHWDTYSSNSSLTRDQELWMFPPPYQSFFHGNTATVPPAFNDQFLYPCLAIPGTESANGARESDSQRITCQMCQSVHPTTVRYKNHLKVHSGLYSTFSLDAPDSHECMWQRI